MTTQIASRRDPWQSVWRLVTGDLLLTVLLLGLVLYVLILALVPQTPTDPFTTDRWLIQAQDRYGETTGFLYEIGLFSLSDSPLPRILLILTAFTLLVRTSERVEDLWRCRKTATPWSKKTLLETLAHIGPLLLLLGLFVGHIWGWRTENLPGQLGDTLPIEGQEITLTKAPSTVQWIQPWTVMYDVGNGPKLIVRAQNLEGRPLNLQQPSQDTLTPELTVLVLAETFETYFAVPEAALVVRVSLSNGASLLTDAPLNIQIFRTPTGERIQEIEFVGEQLDLMANNARLEIHRAPYFILDIAHDPGLWLKVIGLILGTVGLCGILVWPQQRSEHPKQIPPTLYWMLAALTLIVTGWGLGNLITIGLLWNQSPLQAGLGALWLAGLALFQRRESQGQDVQMGGER